MEIRINKSAITQYLLIYLMFIIPGSCLFAKYWTGTIEVFCVTYSICCLELLLRTNINLGIRFAFFYYCCSLLYFLDFWLVV